MITKITKEEIKQIRDNLILSQTEFAKLIGVKCYRTIARWEAGTNKPGSLATEKLERLQRKAERKTQCKLK